MRVVFPAPLWPKIPINSLASTSKVKFFKAYTLLVENNFLKVLLRFTILNPKACALFLELLNTFCLYFLADSSSSWKVKLSYSGAASRLSIPFLLLPLMYAATLLKG